MTYLVRTLFGFGLSHVDCVLKMLFDSYQLVFVTHFSYLCFIFTLGEDQARVSELYRSSVVTEELLLNVNKYWCEHCLRYNEARRSVRYESLPRLLTLQMKRFSSTFGYISCFLKF